MRDFRAVADGRVLDLHEVSHAHRVSDGAARADIRKGTNVRVVADGGIIDLRGVDLRAVADACIFQIAVRSDCAVFADRGLPAQNRSGQQRRPRSDGSRRVHIRRVVVPDLDALLRKLIQLCPRENRLPAGHLLQVCHTVHAVAVGIRHAVVLQKRGEDEFFVQRRHQRLLGDGGHGADNRRAVELLFFRRERQNHRRTRHHNDVLFRLVRCG